MHALCFVLMLAVSAAASGPPALSAAAPAAAAVESFSIARAGLKQSQVDDIITAGEGRYVQVGDRLIDVPASETAGQDVALTRPEGEALLALNGAAARIERLRAAARDGSLTDQDRAEARALAVLGEASLESKDLYFLDSLNVGGSLPGPTPDGSAPMPLLAPPGPKAPADPLTAQLRARLVFDDHGDPAQAQALDMAVRLMLQSPTARELASEFVKQRRRVAVSFEPLDGGGVEIVNGQKYVTGIGGETTHNGRLQVGLNSAYLQLTPKEQFDSLPGILAHELLGHANNWTRAEAAGVGAAMNRWQGDETLASVTGWLVQAEIDGRAGSNGHLWAYLADPEDYARRLHLIMPYYAESFTPEDAERAGDLYAERLGRVQKRIDFLQARLDSDVDWKTVIDHFIGVHGMPPRHFMSLRTDLQYSSKDASRVELKRLITIRAALTKDVKGWCDPESRSEMAGIAKEMKDPFFADGEKRLAAFTGRLRAIAAKTPADKVAPPDPGQLSWDELVSLYQDDRRDHPEHWPAPPTQP